MVFFNSSFMNGATLLGVGLAILGISFSVGLTGNKALVMAIAGYAYIFASAAAFFFPNLSN